MPRCYGELEYRLPRPIHEFSKLLSGKALCLVLSAMRFLPWRERNGVLQLWEFKGKGKLHLAGKIKEDFIKDLAFLESLEG